MDYKDIIKNIRLKEGLNQNDFGKIHGLTQQGMSEIETGKSNPSKTFIAFLKYKYGDNLIPNDEYKTKTRRLSDKLGKPDTREGILELFNDRQAARKINLAMAKIERKDPDHLLQIKGYIQGIEGALNDKPGNK